MKESIVKTLIILQIFDVTKYININYPYNLQEMYYGQ